MGDPAEYTREGLRTILNVLPVAVMVVDQSLSVILVNNAALTFTLKTRDQLLGHAAGDALDCMNRDAAPGGCGFSLNCAACCLRAILKETLETGTPRKRIETTMALERTGERILRFSTLPLTLAKEAAVLLTIEDLTEARVHEDGHIEREKLSAVLETTGGVCHELSQPLQVIMGYCEILSEREGLDGEARDAVAAISLEVEKLARLTHDLTHITRYETKPYLTSKIIDIQKSAATRKSNS